MKGKGPKQERDTIINFNEDEANATIWTASDPVYRRLIEAARQSVLDRGWGAPCRIHFPRELIILPRIKAKRVLTPEQKAQAIVSLHALKYRRKRASRGIPEGLTED